LWNAADDLNITLTGNYSKNGNRGEMSQKAAPFDKASSSSWTAAPNATGSNNSIDQITKGGTANVSWNSPIGNITVVPSYSTSDGSGPQAGNIQGGGGPQRTGTWYSIRKMVQKGAEARIASSEDFKLLQYVVGLSYYKNEFNTSDTYDSPNEDQNTWNKNNCFTLNHQLCWCDRKRFDRSGVQI
jgi:hypothetical protein